MESVNIDQLLKQSSAVAEKAFSTKVDFSNASSLFKASNRVLVYLDRFKIGPRVLALLLVFAFPEESREKMWQEINSTIRAINETSS